MSLPMRYRAELLDGVPLSDRAVFADGNYVRAADLLPRLEAAAEDLGKRIDAALG